MSRLENSAKNIVFSFGNTIHCINTRLYLKNSFYSYIRDGLLRIGWAAWECPRLFIHQ